jgi:hypothetical protein
VIRYAKKSFWITTLALAASAAAWAKMSPAEAARLISRNHHEFTTFPEQCAGIGQALPGR